MPMFMPICVVLLFTLYFILNNIIYKFAKNKNLMPKSRINFKKRYLGAYGFYPRTLIELSLELSMLGLVELVMRQVQEVNEKASYFTGVLCLITIIWFICKTFILSNDKTTAYKIGNSKFMSFNRAYEFLWEDMKVSSSTGVSNYLSFFVARRFTYACIIILSSAFRIQKVFTYAAIIFLNLSLICYIVTYKPF